MPLTLVPTPIGNLEDITLRALRILREADLIACEDTRTSSILLRKYNIQKKLVSFHVHNENQKLESLLQELRLGKKIAVISDAGTPGISDPGWILLKHAINENLEYDVLPGASALLPAILMSGLSVQEFLFLGFPPEKSVERLKLFNELKFLKFTLCFYVSPHKAQKQISDMQNIFGERNCALIREISKVHQEAIRGNFHEILNRINDGLKGEFVFVVEGYKFNPEENKLSWQNYAKELLSSGESLKNIVNTISEQYSVKKNDIKNFLIGSRTSTEFL